jgi:hypothetical protein
MATAVRRSRKQSLPQELDTCLRPVDHFGSLLVSPGLSPKPATCSRSSTNRRTHVNRHCHAGGPLRSVHNILMVCPQVGRSGFSEEAASAAIVGTSGVPAEESGRVELRGCCISVLMMVSARGRNFSGLHGCIRVWRARCSSEC